MDCSQSAYHTLIQAGRRLTSKIGEFVPFLRSEDGLLPPLLCRQNDGTVFPGLSDRIRHAHAQMQELFQQCMQSFNQVYPELTDIPIAVWIARYIPFCPHEKELLYAYAAVAVFSAVQMQAHLDARYGPEKDQPMYAIALEGLTRDYWLEKAVLQEIAVTMYAWLAEQPAEQVAHWFLHNQEAHAALPSIRPVLHRHGYQLENTDSSPESFR